LENFNPDNVGVKGTLFGLPFNEETASLILIPVPWEVTVSFGGGTAQGPENILDSSTQVDLFQPQIHNAWELGIAMLPVEPNIIDLNNELRPVAFQYITQSELDNEEALREMAGVPRQIDEGSMQLFEFIKRTAKDYLSKNKMVGLVGGDHSSPLGLMHALSEKYSDFGILQIDAHADLRESYEGFTYSHASIMFNALQIETLSKLVQVGIRDLGQGEDRIIKDSSGRILCFSDSNIRERLLNGEKWMSICSEIINSLPENVYISFDIDGLEPGLCPGTGTPVPGGLGFHMATSLIRDLAKSGKKIIGFDLCEVGASPWDGNVGARILYSLCNWMGVSQGKLSMTSHI